MNGSTILSLVWSEMKGLDLGEQRLATLAASMANQAMANKLIKGKALDVRTVGHEVEPGVYQLRGYVDDVDYCDAEKEQWIWSIGKRLSDGVILASTDARFYENPDYKCLWLR
jgi:hypothetical protein